MFDAVFGPFFWGRLLATTGVWAYGLASALIAFQATSSTLTVGIVSAAQFIPQLVITPLSGNLTDRGHARAQILTGQVLCAVGCWFLAGWIAFAGLDTGNGLPIIVSSLIVGCGFAVGGSAMQSVVPWLVRPGELETAVALNTIPMTLSRAVGPFVGAALLQTAGAEWIFAIAGLTQLAFGAGLLFVRVPRPRRSSTSADPRMRAALRRIRRDRPLAFLLLGVAAVGVGAEPAVTLVPVVSAQLTGSAAELSGWLAASFGLGATLGLGLLAVRRGIFEVARQGTSGLCLMGAGLITLGLSSVPAVSLCAFGLTGVGMTVSINGLSTLIQQRAPDEFRGRIMALWLIAYVGSRPPAAALNGAVADHVGPSAAFLCSAGAVGLVALAVRPARVRRNPDRLDTFR